MEEYIQFSSNWKNLKLDKKITITTKTSDLDIIKYYLSIQTPLNTEISSLLKGILDLNKLEKENSYLFSLNENDFFKEINSSSFKKKINGILGEYEKKQKVALFSCCKVYLLENYFSKKTIFPSMHKL